MIMVFYSCKESEPYRVFYSYLEFVNSISFPYITIRKVTAHKTDKNYKLIKKYCKNSNIVLESFG